MHTVLTHPLVKHRVTLMRDINTKPKQFRELVNEITEFLAIESLKDLRTVEVPVVTPVAKTTGVKIEDSIVIVPILRAGMGMLDLNELLREGLLIGVSRKEDVLEGSVRTAGELICVRLGDVLYDDILKE